MIKDIFKGFKEHYYICYKNEYTIFIKKHFDT